jgi:hypothetical protein
MLQFDLHPYPWRRNLEWQIKRVINNIESIPFTVASRSSISRFSLRSNDSSTVSYCFEFPHPDCYCGILTLNILVGMRLTEFSNPLLIELLAFDINYHLLTDLVTRGADLSWINISQNESLERLLVQTAFVFRPQESWFLRHLIRFPEIFKTFICRFLSIQTNFALNEGSIGV